MSTKRFIVFICLGTLLSAASFAQTFTEFAGAAAVGTVGGANGKRVSDGLSAVLGRVSTTTEKAAATDGTPKDPSITAAPGTPKENLGPDPSGVPEPPARRVAAKPRVETQALFEPPVEIRSYSEPLPVLPPPPVMTSEDLGRVTQGMARTDLLHMGQPSSKITMYEDGHLVESYSYYQKGERIGSVRLEDGQVARVNR